MTLALALIGSIAATAAHADPQPDPPNPTPAPAVATAVAPAEAVNTTPEPASDAPPGLEGLPPFPIVRIGFETYSLFRADADIDNTANSYAVAASKAGVNALIVTSPVLTLSLGFSSEFSFYEFDGDAPLVAGIPGSNDPFSSAQRHRVSLTSIIRTSEQSTWLLGGAVNATYEPGADIGDSVGGSVLAGYSRAFSEDLTLGVGVNIVFDLDGRPNILPLPFVDWRFAERWRLASDSRGLTLSFEHSDTLSYGVGARFLGREFRLDDDGPIPGGLAQDDAVAVAAVVEWELAEGLALDLAVGAQVFNEFELRNADDAVIFRENGDPALAAAARITFTF